MSPRLRRPHRPTRRPLAPLGLALVVLAVSAPAAPAGTVGTGPGDAVGFTAAASEANRVTLTTSGDRLIVNDAGVATMGMSGACTMVDPQTASCPVTPQTRVTVRGGDLDDGITNASGIGAELLGGDGHDVLRGGAAAERLEGDAGPDDLDGGAGDDVLGAGPGPPVADADIVAGGPGTDSVSYAARSAGVVVTEDGVANDGAAGEGDNIALDVEQVTGSPAADRLLGGSGPNVLDGGPGDDNVDGGPGADTTQGGMGADTLSGGPGADQIVGGPDTDVVTYSSLSIGVTVDLGSGTGRSEEPGDVDTVREVESATGGRWTDTLTGTAAGNTLEGAAGEDYVEGGRGPDRLDGGASDDVVDARDGGRDAAVTCGPGVDLAITDRGDPVARRGPDRCERVDDGSDRRPRRGFVVVRPARCPGAEQDAQVGLPAMSRLVPLRDSILLATGSQGRRSPRLAATDCAVRLAATPGRGPSVAAEVTGAQVTVRQSAGRQVITTLRVARPRCGAGGRGSAVRRDRRVRLKTQRRPGRWQVEGRYSVGASRGTDWTTLEGCARTVTIVRRGRVRVYDRVKHRTVVVRAGKRYVARRR